MFPTSAGRLGPGRNRTSQLRLKKSVRYGLFRLSVGPPSAVFFGSGFTSSPSLFFLFLFALPLFSFSLWCSFFFGYFFLFLFSFFLLLLLYKHKTKTMDIDVDAILAKLLEVKGTGRGVMLQEGEIRQLCMKAREIFISQPILLELEAPIKICGL